MLFGFGRTVSAEYRYNLVPFKAIYISFTDYVWNDFRHFAVNIFGNIGMFMPFGILLTLLFSLKKAFIIFIIGVLTLETAQLISRRGVFDVDDIILNSIGFLTGYAIIKIIKRGRRK